MSVVGAGDQNDVEVAPFEQPAVIEKSSTSPPAAFTSRLARSRPDRPMRRFRVQGISARFRTCSAPSCRPRSGHAARHRPSCEPSFRAGSITTQRPALQLGAVPVPLSEAPEPPAGSVLQVTGRRSPTSAEQDMESCIFLQDLRYQGFDDGEGGDHRDRRERTARPAREERMAGIAIRRVQKIFGWAPVIHGIDLDVRDGEFVVLVGPSGCGSRRCCG